MFERRYTGVTPRAPAIYLSPPNLAAHLSSVAMEVLEVDPVVPDAASVRRAALVLRGGGLVAFPTETVYGLGAHALDPVAVGRIYAAKGRPRFNPLIVHIASAESVPEIAREWPADAALLAERFWPGPLTLVVPKRTSVPDAITAGLDTVAIRVPAHPVAIALLRASEIPVAAPSANRSTRVSPTTARHVVRSLGRSVDLVLDAGPTQVGIESTVVDVTGPVPVVLRPGVISLAMLADALGREVGVAAQTSGAAARRSPGMIDRHYAPAATVRLFSEHDTAEVLAALEAAAASGRRTGALLRATPELAVSHLERLPGDAAGYARALYAALHALDEAGVELAFIERVPDAPEWSAVRDRLERAAR